MSVKDSIEVMVPLASWQRSAEEAQRLELQLFEANDRAEAAERDRLHMAETLTRAQHLSTLHLEIARAVKAIGDDAIMQRLAPLAAAILRDTETFPQGRGFQLLIATVGRLGAELAAEPDPKRKDRIRAAMLDLAVASTRAWLYLGDQ